MKLNAVVAGLVAVVLSAGQAGAWGPKGHQVVGSIADRLLKPSARAQVSTVLGFTLRVAGTWADCVKSVKPQPNGNYKYIEEPLYSAPCKPFQAPQHADEQARMEDFVTRNWNQCSYQNHSKGCEDTYHFADVPIQRDRYDRIYPGTADHDIVSAINAAIAVLKGQPAAPPISIRDKKEALLLLAHLLGDLHQPLHVGSIYLDAQGRRVNPPDGSAPAEKTETAGGNFIYDGSQKLHAKWDAIPSSLGNVASDDLVNRARAVEATPGPVELLAAAWASETILVARSAFAGTTFRKTGNAHWIVTLPAGYWAAQNKIKQQQLARSGARLAELLNKIWP